MNDYGTDDRYGGPLEPDVLLPTQFFGALRQKAQLDGERRLMVAVLDDAVNCFQKHIAATDPKARQLFLDAENWILDDDDTYFFSFRNVCSMLDLDSDYVRDGLRKWKQARLRVAPESAAADDERDTPLMKASGA